MGEGHAPCPGESATVQLPFYTLCTTVDFEILKINKTYHNELITVTIFIILQLELRLGLE